MDTAGKPTRITDSPKPASSSAWAISDVPGVKAGRQSAPSRVQAVRSVRYPSKGITADPTGDSRRIRELEAQVSAMREEQLRYLAFAVQNQRAHDLQMPEVQMVLRSGLQGYLGKDPKTLFTQAQYLVDHTRATSSDCASFLLLRKLWADF